MEVSVNVLGSRISIHIQLQPDKEPYLLKAGDIIESKIANLGRLQNTVVNEPMIGSHA